MARFLQDLTKIIHFSKIVSYHDRQNSKIIKNTIPSVQAAETQSEGSFHPEAIFFLVFIIKMLQPAGTNMHAKMCKKIMILYSGFRTSDENPNNSLPV